jgi:INO80 complex subunit C
MFVAKYRNKEKANRNTKSSKNLILDNLQSISLNTCILLNLIFIDNSLEAGPSVLPKKKYCDVTGLESKYVDPRSGLRYYNSDIFKLVQNFTEPLKNQYLSLRKALFIIK